MPVLEISVVPVGTGDTSFSSFVAEACKQIEDKNFKYHITATGTVVEGELHELLNLAEEMHRTPFQMGAERVITNITLDDRNDQPSDMEEQIESVGRQLN